ncbi:MAG: DUF2933 domain-containing protein [Rhodospirillaceae bacterium]|nr:MAG: DUF2933 domain-containing protein [Rhodospirillaceae bacterium]
METTNAPLPRSHGSSCHGTGQSSGSLFSRHRELFLAGGAAALALGLALSQHWVTLAALAPLLYVLPCAVMMFMCMRGMGHKPQAGSSQDTTNTEKTAKTSPEVW